MEFYNQRFSYFNKLTLEVIEGVCKDVFRHHAAHEKYIKIIASNIIERRDYVYKYFCKHIPEKLDKKGEKKYDAMGSVFKNL